MLASSTPGGEALNLHSVCSPAADRVLLVFALGCAFWLLPPAHPASRSPLHFRLLLPLRCGTFATAGSDGTYNFWDKDSKQRLKAMAKCSYANNVPAPIPCAAFNRNGSIYAYAGASSWPACIAGCWLRRAWAVAGGFSAAVRFGNVQLSCHEVSTMGILGQRRQATAQASYLVGPVTTNRSKP